MDVRYYLNDLKQIEKIFLTCYGKKGKSTLIQSKNNSSETTSFLLTNDAMTILNCLTFKDNQILILLVETIRKNSTANGDNCKTLFIYILTFLVDLFESNNRQQEVENFISFIKKTNLVFVYEEFLKEWNTNLNNPNISSIKINTTEDFLSIVPKLSVLDDLNGINKVLASISSSLICDLIRNPFVAEPCSISEIPNKLHQLLGDLDHTLVYSDKYNIDKSKIYENGFLLNNRVLINHFDKHTAKNAIFLLIQREEMSETHIEISSNYEEKILNSFYAQKKNFFSKNFLECLKSNNINVVLTSNCLSELQKSQLNSLNISLIGYLNEDLIRFICRKLSIEPLEIDTISSDDFHHIHLQSSCIALDSIDVIDSATLTFFKISKRNTLNFILFCSPIKLQFGQFKSHLTKVVKTLLTSFNKINLLDSQDNQNLSSLFIRTSCFEKFSTTLFENLKNSNLKNTEKCLFYKYLIKIFDLLIHKLSGQKLLKHESICNSYEPIGLKFECFIKSLYFVQNILKIDKIFLTKKTVNL